MKLRLISALVIAVLAQTPDLASAQSSVTLYGIVDTGVAYLSNEGGKSAVVMAPGVQQADRFGFKGSEDLGGGYRAIFTLENGFNVANGTLGQGGLEFGRQAWVGLETPAGKIAAGRQYDYMQSLLPYTTAGAISGLYGFHIGDYDRVWGERLNSALSYQSPIWNGLRFSALYSFGGQPGQFREGSAESANLSYTDSNVSLGLSYTKIYNTSITPASSIGYSQLYGSTNTGTVTIAKNTNIGLGGSYVWDKLTFHGVYTRTYLDSGLQEAIYQVLDGGVNYQLRPAFVVGAGYSYTKLDSAHWGTIMGGIDYFLSKRTDVYANVNYIHATGEGATATLLLTTPSNGRDQVAVAAGIRHKF